MRVTDAMLYDLVSRNGQAAKSRLDQATAQESSGSRVVHPGDDPGAAGLIVTGQMNASTLDTIATTAGRAADELQTTDGALSAVADGVSRARQLAVQLSTSTYSASDRAAAASEVQGILASAVASLNAKVGNRYVLGGFQDGAPPFDAAGNYAGDQGVRQVEIAPGVYQAANVNAAVAVKGANGGVDILATLSALATALQSNDVSGVQATIDQLAQGTSQLATARGQAGAAMSTLDAAVTANQAARDTATKTVSGLADVDAIAAATNLAQAQYALQASLTATAQSFNLTLVNKL
ncbi:MAG TPA: flagellar hook-associated protein FlgL [Anaeromyxobacter sp.]|nr:flagellar hook-associated protein FlgL [Anaeromyxobacter sp.]